MGSKEINILIAVAHPDDESIWVGGLIYELSRLKAVRVHVVSLTGDPIRNQEFYSALNIAGCNSSYAPEGIQVNPHIKISKVIQRLEIGLGVLGINCEEIDLVITHSPYGDEHCNPHHSQLSEEIFQWAHSHSLIYGFFSCIPLLGVELQPLLNNLMRNGTLQILNFSKCKHLFWRKYSQKYRNRRPDYYLQFQICSQVKGAMLNCYQSIDLIEHESGYASFTLGVESLYLQGTGSIQFIGELFSRMQIPGSKDLFLLDWRSQSVWRRILNRFNKLRNTWRIY